MKTLLRLEELAMLAIGIIALHYCPVHISPYLWPIVFLAPDIGAIGYLMNPAVGAVTYNLTHHKGLAILLVALGAHFGWPVVLFIGLLLFAHASFDRIFGYGLKYGDAFKHTHLGWLGTEGTKDNNTGKP